MATLSTLGQMMLNLAPQMPQYDPQQVARQQQLLQAGRMGNETALLQLEDLRRQQEASAQVRAYYQEHPEALVGGGPPMATIGTLGQPGGAPGAITQQSFGPGGVGPAQTVPAYPDQSRYAGVSPQGGGPIPPDMARQLTPTVTPPGAAPTLGTLGQPQAPQNPIEALIRRNPDAGLQILDMQTKRQTQQLTMREKVAEAIASELQGATDQASYDLAREQVRQISPQWAAALPQTYSKEGVQPWVDRALSAKDKATIDATNLQTQVDLYKARVSAAGQQIVPKYTGDAQRDSLIHSEMQRQGLTGTPPQSVLDTVEQRIQQGKVAVSGAQGVEAARLERTEKPLEGVAGKAVSDLTLLRTMTDDVLAMRKDAYTGPFVGRSGYLREQGGFMDPEETAFRSTLKNVNDILGRLRSGANIPAPEMANLERLAPSVNDPPETFKAKMQSFQRALEQQRESITRVGTTGRQQLREETTPTTPRVGQSTSQQPQGPATFDRADFLRWRQGTGKSGNPTAADVQAYFEARGLKRR